MKIEYDGRPRELDLTDVELKAAVVIQGFTGLSLRQWGRSLEDDLEPDGETVKLAAVDKPEFLRSLQAVFWLMLYQNGETEPIADVNFRIGAFSEALGAAMVAEAQAAAGEPEPEPDPTQPPPDSEPSPEPSSPAEESPEGTGGEGTPDG